jgi:aryl-alcohol dehydrogenase-like predicted oxidoreductase
LATARTQQERSPTAAPYSPLGRGFLTAKITNLDGLAKDDWRRGMPRFEQENFRRNMELVEKIRAIAARRGCTPAQLALAWVLTQGDDIPANT